MKKVILSAFFAFLLATGTKVSAQTVLSVADAVAAIEKGHLTKPTPPVLNTINNNPAWAALFNPLKDYIVWYKYKGILYSFYIVEEHYIMVAFKPNGDFVDYFEFDL